jgi:hypothetical protein
MSSDIAWDLIKVRPDCTLVILDDQGRPCVELRPGYEPALGPVIHIYRVGIHESQTHLLTLRLPAINTLVRRLPIALAAAKRLQAKAQNPAK